jgi:hypothetical protein
MTTKLALIRTLRGLTPLFGYLDDVHVDELRMEHHLSGNPMLIIAASWHWIRKIQARYLAGDYAAAADALSKAQPWAATPFPSISKQQSFASMARFRTLHLGIPRLRMKNSGNPRL